MPNGGELKIVAGFDKKLQYSETQKASGSIIVYITDTGKGIDKDKIEKIFNPFFTTKSDGVGLGLSISSRLLEENQSKMEVESELNKGTTFKLFLPFVNNNQE